MNRKKSKGLLIVLFLIFCLTFPSSTRAASDKSNALRAYKTMLSARTMKWGSQKIKISTSGVKFSLAYINNDSIPELLIFAGSNNHVTGSLAVYTWNKGKTVLLANCRDGIAYYKKTGIFSTYTSLQGEYEVYYKAAKGKAVQKLSSYVGYGTSYKQGTKSVSERTFKKLVKSLTKGKRAAKIIWQNNTAANRNKYLK